MKNLLPGAEHQLALLIGTVTMAREPWPANASGVAIVPGLLVA